MDLIENKLDHKLGPEQYIKYMGKKVAVTISESIGYFSGRDYECERVMPDEHKEITLVLEKITPEGLEGYLENGEQVCVKYSDHQEKQLSSELETGIRRCQIIEKRVWKVELV